MYSNIYSREIDFPALSIELNIFPYDFYNNLFITFYAALEILGKVRKLCDNYEKLFKVNITSIMKGQGIFRIRF